MASTYQKRGTWYLNFKDATGRRRSVASAAATKTEARRLAADMERKAERQRYGLEPLPGDSDMTFGKLCEWWLKERCPAGSLYDERKRIGRHVLATPLASVPVRFVTSAVIDQRLREMERDGAAPASLNKLRSILHTVYARAAKADVWNGRNPTAAVDTRRVPKRAYETVRAEEVPVLLAHVPDDWRGVFAAALYTAMRKGELFGLRKADVDLEHGTITVARSYDRDTTKGGHADVIPIAPPLKPYLAAALESPGDLVFPAPGAGMRSPEADPQKVLRHALARAGIVVGYDHVCRRCKARHEATHTERHPDAVERRCGRCGMRLWPRALPRPMRFHDLRHSTATLLLRAGVDAHRVQRILRHRDVKTTTAIYAHLDVEDLRDAVARLPGDANAPEGPEAGSAPVGAVAVAGSVWDALPRSTRLLPDRAAPKAEGPTRPKSPGNIGPSEWALLVSNQRPPPCEDGALPLS